MARTQRHRLMSIGTPLGDDKVLIRSISGTEELGRPFQYNLDLLSEEEIDFSKIVGHNVTVRLETTKGVTRYVNGLVSSFSQSRRTGRLASYRATVVPWLWLLTRTTDCRMFQEKMVPDIIKEIFRDHGLTDFDDRLTKTYRQWEYCVQYRETDFNFVSRLMEQEGIYYYFEHEDGKHKLVLCDSKSCHQPFSGYATISYRPPEQASTEIEHIRSWQCEKRVQPGAYVHDDFDFKNPKNELEAQCKITQSHSAADFEMYDYPGEYTQSSEGDQGARVRMEEMAAQHEVVSGGGDVRGICCGCKFRLEDYPRQDQCREYLITSASLSATSDEYDSAGGGAGSFCDASLTSIPADVQYRAERGTPKPLIQGPQTAIVTGPAGEEIYTDSYGRVKVQFHWDRRSKGNETSSCWIRVSQIWAGKKWGGMIIPRIGQEVIVEFLEGDPDRPIITGRVYNGEAMPPNELPAQKVKMSIKSNSTKGGGGYNELTFDDTKSNERIYIHAQYNEDERVENDSKEWIGNDRHLIVTANQFEKVIGDKHLHVVQDQLEQIDGDRHVHVKTDDMQKVGGNLSLTVGADHDARVSMGYTVKAMTIHLKAETQIIIEAPIIDIKASGPCNIEAGATLTLKGATVLINSGGGAATATDAQPEAPTAPTDPLVASTGAAGEVDQAPPKPKPPTPPTYSDQAKVMKKAAESGTPFCEQCAAAREAAEAKRGTATQGGDHAKKAKGAAGGKKAAGGHGHTSGGGGGEGGQTSTSGGEAGAADDEDWGRKAGGGGGAAQGDDGGGGSTTVGMGGEGADEGESIVETGTEDSDEWGGSADAGMGGTKGSANVGDE